MLQREAHPTELDIGSLLFESQHGSSPNSRLDWCAFSRFEYRVAQEIGNLKRQVGRIADRNHQLCPRSPLFEKILFWIDPARQFNSIANNWILFGPLLCWSSLLYRCLSELHSSHTQCF